MTRNAIVLMTALLPTIGHRHLIEFASNLVDGTVHVVLSSRDKEPIAGDSRVTALNAAFPFTKYKVIIHHHKENDAPQNPHQHFNFWKIWKDIVNKHVPGIRPTDVVVASEKYGIDLAKALGCEFIPCDIYREIYPVQGTSVRKYPLLQWEHILPEFKPYLMKTITIFGAESCGKTTMARRLANDMNGIYVPEWARGYLETIGPDITEEKMANIVDAQYASQKAVWARNEKPFIFQDTDLLSTIGYYRIYNGDIPSYIKEHVMTLFRPADLYVLMNDGIPFEPDILRYGGHKRESDMGFWSNLLNEFNCRFIQAPTGNHEKQTDSIKYEIESWYEKQLESIMLFERD
jgi:HTH-type transcriptional regulator, transcriptional repressor of NAD biosynthesis genes